MSVYVCWWKGWKSISRKWRLRSIAGGHCKRVCAPAQCISRVTHVPEVYFSKSHTSSWLALDLWPSHLWAAARNFSFQRSVRENIPHKTHACYCSHGVPSLPLFLTCKLQFGAQLQQARLSLASRGLLWLLFKVSQPCAKLVKRG